jgi:hypothetical protein
MIIFGANVEEVPLYAVDALEIGLFFYLESHRALPSPSKTKKDEMLVTVQGR